MRTSHGVAEQAPRTASPTPSAWRVARRRLTTSTVALVGIVALEVGALAVLGVHLASGRGEVATVSSSATYGPPVHLLPGTAYVRSTVIAPNTIVVTHWIHAGRGAYRVRIQVPRLPGLAPDALAVSDLVVVSDGRSIAEPTLPHGLRVQTYLVPPGRHFYVSYVLTGPIEPSGSPKGSEPSMVTALGVSTPPSPVTRTTHSVVGAPVLGLTCSANRPKADATPCGRKVGSAWRVDLRSAHAADRVMARMELP